MDETNEQIIEKTLELVDQAQQKGTFDITAFAKDRAYPQDTVVAYLDVDSAYKLTAANEKLSRTLAGEEYDVLESEANELAAKIVESKIVFHLRGVNQEIIERVTVEANKTYPSAKNSFGQDEVSEDWIRFWTTSLVAENLIKIVNSKGEEDERKFTQAEVLELRKYLPKEVWELIVEKMQQLTLASSYFKGLTDAGFLPKS
jgi:chitodextrinase